MSRGLYPNMMGTKEHAYIDIPLTPATPAQMLVGAYTQVKATFRRESRVEEFLADAEAMKAKKPLEDWTQADVEELMERSGCRVSWTPEKGEE